MQISTLIRTIMKKNNLTITEVALMSGVARTTVSDLVNNTHTPTLKTVTRVLRALL